MLLKFRTFLIVSSWSKLLKFCYVNGTLSRPPSVKRLYNLYLLILSDKLLAVGSETRDGDHNSNGHSEGHYFDNIQEKWVDIDNYPFAVSESTF